MKRTYRWGLRAKENIKKLDVLTDEDFLWIANKITVGLIIKDIDIEFMDEDVVLKFGKDGRVSIGPSLDIAWQEGSTFNPSLGQVEVFKFLVKKGIIDI
jgi:hypothetical protein